MAKGNLSEAVQRLIPTEIPRPRHDNIALDDLPSDQEIQCDPPDTGLVTSMERFGLLEPIVVCDRNWHSEKEGDQFKGPESQRFLLGPGRRRVKAARKLGWDLISARVFPIDFAEAGILTLLENSHRSPNVLADYQAAVELLKHGGEARDLARATSIPVTTINKALELANLIPGLFKALCEGKFKVTLAILIAKLDQAKQSRLMSILEETGKLSMADLKSVKSAGAAAVGLLDDSDFQTPSAELPADWQERVQKVVEWLDTVDPKKVNKSLLRDMAETLRALLPAETGDEEAETEEEYAVARADEVTAEQAVFGHGVGAEAAQVGLNGNGAEPDDGSDSAFAEERELPAGDALAGVEG